MSPISQVFNLSFSNLVELLNLTHALSCDGIHLFCQLIFTYAKGKYTREVGRDSKLLLENFMPTPLWQMKIDR